MGIKTNNVRRMLGFLQVYPIITGIIFVLNATIELLPECVSEILGYLFGSSLFVLIYLLLLSRNLYISKWSKCLYVMLTITTIFDIVDYILGFPDKPFVVQQILLIIVTVSTIASFITFLYDKFKFEKILDNIIKH